MSTDTSSMVQAVIDGQDPQDVVQAMVDERQIALPPWTLLKKKIKDGKKVFQLIRTDLPKTDMQANTIGWFGSEKEAVKRAWRWYHAQLSFA